MMQRITMMLPLWRNLDQFSVPEIDSPQPGARTEIDIDHGGVGIGGADLIACFDGVARDGCLESLLIQGVGYQGRDKRLILDYQDSAPPLHVLGAHCLSGPKADCTI